MGVGTQVLRGVQIPLFARTIISEQAGLVFTEKQVGWASSLVTSVCGRLGGFLLWGTAMALSTVPSVVLRLWDGA